jgi:purine-binding chemotaxis protein CheW
MTSPSNEIKFLTFTINETVIGLDILDVQEVTKVSDITATPRTPDYVEGIINLRGNIVTVVKY